ncbi:MAG TPA: heparan-alpha-glucosaminide N-acetyltransferase domain-containing protein [Blastocatellia bacterium]|nr:heparan-alpha-glucosaminide N-acetyltransferase domain-containing protein [Blastocatellia bacterium]
MAQATTTAPSPVTAVKTETAANSQPAKRARIDSLDIARGVVMVLMAIDHVRVYSGQPAGGPTAGIFFTRWITHFCAPAFVFFAGTGAYLYGKKLGNKGALAKYLLTRGLMLVVLELTLIRFTWTFNFHYSQFVLAGVIWMLGWCMVMMAALIWLPTWANGALGIAMVLFQQIFQAIPAHLPESLRNAIAPYYEFLYPAGSNGPSWIAILYVLIPWIGVMAVGYAFGAIMTYEPARRRKICLAIGSIATVLFIIFGLIFLYQAPPPKNPTPALFRLLNQSKYPPSTLFLLMTLGPMITLVGLAEHMRGWFAGLLTTFGRVPLFYYLLHIPLIHVTALAIFALRGGVQSVWFATAPFTGVPPANRWSLGLLYLAYFVDLIILYFACRWYADVKSRHPKGFLRYL